MYSRGILVLGGHARFVLSGLVFSASRTAMAAANTTTVITNAAKNAACTMSL